MLAIDLTATLAGPIGTHTRPDGTVRYYRDATVMADEGPASITVWSKSRSELERDTRAVRGHVLANDELAWFPFSAPLKKTAFKAAAFKEVADAPTAPAAAAEPDAPVAG